MIAIDKPPKTRVIAVMTQTKHIEFEYDGIPVGEKIREILEDKFGCADKLIGQTIDVLSIDTLS